MKILLFLHFIYSLCLFFDLIKALAADFLCPQTTFFGTKLDSLKKKKKKTQDYNRETVELKNQCWKQQQVLYSVSEYTVQRQ